MLLLKKMELFNVMIKFFLMIKICFFWVSCSKQQTDSNWEFVEIKIKSIQNREVTIFNVDFKDKTISSTYRNDFSSKKVHENFSHNKYSFIDSLILLQNEESTMGRYSSIVIDTIMVCFYNSKIMDTIFIDNHSNDNYYKILDYIYRKTNFYLNSMESYMFYYEPRKAIHLTFATDSLIQKIKIYDVNSNCLYKSDAISSDFFFENVELPRLDNLYVEVQTFSNYIFRKKIDLKIIK